MPGRKSPPGRANLWLNSRSNSAAQGSSCLQVVKTTPHYMRVSLPALREATPCAFGPMCNTGSGKSDLLDWDAGVRLSDSSFGAPFRSAS